MKWNRTAPLPPIRGVLLDMDGLLIDSEHIAQQCCIQAGYDLGYPIDQTLARRFLGVTHDGCVQILQDAFPGIDAESLFRHSRELLKGLSFHPDIVLLDPMFPGRQKSGLVKKKAQLLQKLEKPCEDEEGLLQAAVSAGPRKIVIKRPLKGPFLAGRKPDYSITGKTIRYDCLLVTTA